MLVMYLSIYTTYRRVDDVTDSVANMQNMLRIFPTRGQKVTEHNDMANKGIHGRPENQQRGITRVRRRVKGTGRTRTAVTSMLRNR